MNNTQDAPAPAPNKQNAGQEISYLGARLREKSTYGGLAVAVGLALPFLIKLDPHLAGTNADTIVTAISYVGMGVGIFIGIFLPEKGSKAVIAFLIGAPIALALLGSPAHAQSRVAAARPAPAVSSAPAVPQFQLPQLPCDPLKLIPFCKDESGQQAGPTAQTPDDFSGLLQEIYDKIHSGGTAVIADMQKAQAIAQQKFSDGTEADAPSDKCLAAVIPVAQLIVDNQLVAPGVTPAANGAATPATGGATPAPAAVPDGPITIFVKMRVIVNALQNPSVQSGCAWLQSSINQAGTTGLANVLAGLVGLTKLGVAIPGVAL
jgi:hypothetical protein